MSEVKPNKTICIDHDITEIVDEINKQGGKLSPVVCNLLRFYRDNDYRIPMLGRTFSGSSFKPEPLDDDEIAEIRREQGVDDE